MSSLAFLGSAIQLVPDGTLLFHLLLVVLMVSLLNVTLLRPINRVLTEREHRTKGSSMEAQSVLASVDQKMQDYEARLREGRAKGYALLESERATAWRERELQVVGVKAEVARWSADAKEKLKRDEEEAKERLTKDAHARATEIGGRILGRPLSSL